MSTIRLWDSDMNLLVTEEASAPKPGRSEVAVSGAGRIYHTAKQYVTTNSGDLYITIDLTEEEYANMFYLRRRRGGKVTQIEVEERKCECRQNRIITTTICWASAVLGSEL